MNDTSSLKNENNNQSAKSIESDRKKAAKERLSSALKENIKRRKLAAKIRETEE